MSNVKTGPESIADIDTKFKKNAMTKKDRRTTLTYCLDKPWNTANIGRLERVDNTRFHGWKMWEWKKWDA